MGSPTPTNQFVATGEPMTRSYKSFSRTWKKLENNSKTTKQKRKKIPILTGHHHKLLSYRGTFFLMKYMHLRKPGFELPSSSLVRTFLTATLHSHLWLYGVCYSFILILKLICRGRWRHHPPLQIICRGGWCHHPPLKIVFYFIQKII